METWPVAWPPNHDGGMMITLARAEPGHLPAFKRELQDAFGAAVIETFGPLTDGPIPSDEDIEESFAAPGAVILEILQDGQRIGGAVLTIDEETQENELGFFFIKVGEEGRGLGLEAWRAIEAIFPETRVWVPHTPYFEKRNIHFYLNKCGFKIVEFYHDDHRDPEMPELGEVPGGDEMFRFEKIMPAR